MLDLRRLPDRIGDALRERILSGGLPPGEPLRQDALAAEMGVSKIPVREAMARLEQEGLVRAEANRGWFVQPLSAAEAQEVFALRLKLEPELAGRAAFLADEAERAEASACLAALDASVRESPAAVGACNRAFHLALLRPARSPIAVSFLDRIHLLSERYVRKHLEPRGRGERARAEHAALLQSWLQRDGDTVARLTTEHIAATLANLSDQLG